MSNQHIYLIASLPMLQFPGRMSMGYPAFLENCRGLIPDGQLEMLRVIPRLWEEKTLLTRQVTLAKWVDFETSLRNELVKLRCQKQQLESARYLRGQATSHPALAQAAFFALKENSLLEQELVLDQARWQYLDELCFGHYFDFDFLVVYALKLLILERWQNIRQADTLKLTEEVLA